MKRKVKKVKNIQDDSRNFDITKVLNANSDCLMGLHYTYKNGDTEYFVYSNMETNEMIEIPAEYKNAFEKANYIISLSPIREGVTKNIIKSNKNDVETNSKKLIRSFVSNR